MSFRARRLNQKGWTLVELMITTAIIGVITPALTFLFAKASQGMAADEMRIQLQNLNSLNLMRIHERSSATKHLMEDDANGRTYLAAVTNGMSAETLAQYPIMSNSKMPSTQPSAVTFASFSTTAGAVPADFGNMLLFGAYDMTQTINSTVYKAPVTIYTSTISGTSYPVTFNSGYPATILMDIYRFYFYYLTSNNPGGPKGASSSRLMEWQSVQYADYRQINNLNQSVTALTPCLVKWLVAGGAGAPITWAWDTRQAAANDSSNIAIYSLADTGTMTLVNNPTIPEGQVMVLSRLGIPGILSSGFGYGISPNTSGWKEAPPVPSPRYATANGDYPGGFEVGISGNRAGRQVFTRSCLVAKGGAPKVVYNEGEMVHNVRDVW